MSCTTSTRTRQSFSTRGGSFFRNRNKLTAGGSFFKNMPSRFPIVPSCNQVSENVTKPMEIDAQSNYDITFRAIELIVELFADGTYDHDFAMQKIRQMNYDGSGITVILYEEPQLYREIKTSKYVEREWIVAILNEKSYTRKFTYIPVVGPNTIRDAPGDPQMYMA